MKRKNKQDQYGNKMDVNEGVNDPSTAGSDSQQDQDQEHRRGVNSELRNEDPITGEPGSHPVGTGVGTAIGAAAAGAAAGAAGGPVGVVVGAVVGGIAGGFVGKATAESVDPTLEAAYWESHYQSRPYYTADRAYSFYYPAYAVGWESYRGPGSTWEEQEPVAQKKWESVSRWENEGGAPPMTWEEARLAAQDAHDRIAARHVDDEDELQARQNKPR